MILLVISKNEITWLKVLSSALEEHSPHGQVLYGSLTLSVL